MTKPLPIKRGDTVEVLTGCRFSSLVQSKGIVIDSLSFMSCVVEFPTEKRSQDFDTMEVLQSKFWCIHWKYLKVIESAYDDAIGELESKIQDLEDNLMFSQSCLAMSEELRDQQVDLIEKLVQELDVCKAKMYSLGGGIN